MPTIPESSKLSAKRFAFDGTPNERPPASSIYVGTYRIEVQRESKTFSKGELGDGGGLNDTRNVDKDVYDESARQGSELYFEVTLK